MYNEARDRAADGAEWYDAVLKTAPTDQSALRRQIAAVKAQAGPGAAIPLLVAHVEVFQNDLEAWQELGELYLQVCPRVQAQDWDIGFGLEIGLRL